MCFLIVLGQCDDFVTDDEDDEDDGIVIKSNRFELLALGSIIATFAVVLLLATCLLVTLLNRFAGGAVVYEYEQSKCVSPAAVRRRPVEDVPLSQVVFINSIIA